MSGRQRDVSALATGLGSAASAIPGAGAAVQRFFEGLGLVELDWCEYRNGGPMPRPELPARPCGAARDGRLNVRAAPGRYPCSNVQRVGCRAAHGYLHGRAGSRLGMSVVE